MNIAICDDEKVFIQEIKQKIQITSEKIKTKITIDEYTKGKNLLKSNSKYDVVFLDIEMPEMDGLTLATSYRQKHPTCLIIFLTSHSEFSCEGYKVSAFRFLNKLDYDADFEEAILSASKFSEGKRKILVKTLEGGQAVLDYDDIIFIETEGRKVRVHSKFDEFIVSETISSIQKRLDSTNFYLVHRSYLVNISYIGRCEKRELIMKDGTEVLLSEKKRKAFMAFYLGWKFERGNG